MKWTNTLRRVGAVLALVFLTGATANVALAQQAPPSQPPGQEAPADPGDAAPVVPIDIPARSAIIVRGTSKWDDGFKNITDAFSKLRAEASKLQLTVNGKPLAVFVQSDDEGFTFEAMMPVQIDPAAAPKLSEGITAGRSPGGSALKFEHRGAYDDIESTYEAIAAYLDEKGLAARDELIEEFANETVSSDDTALSVDIYVLLKQ